MSVNKKEFLTRYILSLKERTRNEKTKGYISYGFDWIIYQLQFQKGEMPKRLPFFRAEKIEDLKTKPYESEFGIDLSFLNQDKKILSIFVLKDEALTHSNWINFNFDKDLRRAIYPDIEGLDLSEVKIILAYNKDEDSDGVKCFEDFKNAQNSKLKENVILTFERWNLSKIVEEVENHLLTPELFPQNLSGILSYLCSQIAEFDFMSPEWQNQLVPNWKRFLETVLKDRVDEARINLIGLALIILNNHQKENNTKDIAWIDLIEWSTLYLWNSFRNLKTETLKKIINELWVGLYLKSLEGYIDNNKLLFEVEHGLKTDKRYVSHLTAIHDSMLCYDFIAKFCIMTLGLFQYIPEEEKCKIFMEQKASLLNNFIRLNPSVLRPLLDIHHVQIFMIWNIFFKMGYDYNIKEFFIQLENYLMVRRIGNTNIPFIEGRNNLDLLVEYAVEGEKPYEFVDDASYLLMMIIELVVGLVKDNGKKFTEEYFRHLILGFGDDDKPITKLKNTIDLQSWEPPDRWDERIFLNKVNDGTSISSANFFVNLENIDELDDKIKDFLIKTSEKFPNKIRFDIPFAVYLLACIKNKSPLPPVFWRYLLFNDLYKNPDDKNSEAEKENGN